MPGGFLLGLTIIRRAQNCSDSDWDCLIRPRLSWPEVDLWDTKHGLAVFLLSVFFPTHTTRFPTLAIGNVNPYEYLSN